MEKGILYNVNKSKWTEDEKEYLIKKYNELGRECYNKIPNRSYNQVRNMINILNLSSLSK